MVYASQAKACRARQRTLRVALHEVFIALKGSVVVALLVMDLGGFKGLGFSVDGIIASEHGDAHSKERPDKKTAQEGQSTMEKR